MDYITYWKTKGAYGKIRIERMLVRKEKRKKKKGSYTKCPQCGRETGSYVKEVIDPYQYEMNGYISKIRMCSDCYQSACGDI